MYFPLTCMVAGNPLPQISALKQLQAPDHEVEVELDLHAKQQERIAAPDALPAGPNTEAMAPPGAAAVNDLHTAERLEAAALDDSSKPVPSNAQASSGDCPFLSQAQVTR